jgi:ABC-type multidrug transport system fused ATPase/permease subunit
MISAENQAIRLRKDYFKALLRQDMAWIDVNQPGEAASRLAEDTVTFQVILSCKLNHMILLGS